MAQLSLYNGEVYQRSSARYAIFGTIVGCIVIVSFLYAQYATVLLIFFFLGAYIYFSVQQHTLSTISIERDGITFGSQKKLFGQIQGFTVISDNDSLKTFIFVVEGKLWYYTLPPETTNEEIQPFIDGLYDNIALIETIGESSINRRKRRWKL